MNESNVMKLFSLVMVNLLLVFLLFNGSFYQGFNIVNKAASTGDIRIMGFLLEKGYSINKNTLMGITPLHSAVMNNQYKMAEYLINNGANVNARERDAGRNSLYFAAVNRNGSIIKLLLANGSDVDSRSFKTIRNNFVKKEIQNMDYSTMELLKKRYAQQEGTEDE